MGLITIWQGSFGWFRYYYATNTAMPVFISYSRKDRGFVTQLAANLVRNKANVWLDEWEVAAGESLIDKIQSGIQGATALVAVFSKASVKSVWCKREINAAIQRELEERRVVVIPALLENCQIPIFLRDKKYADFRSDFDDGLQSVLVGIAKVTNPSLGRIEGDKYHTDWSIDSGYFKKQFFLEFNLVNHSIKWPYSVLSKITILCSKEATTRYKLYEESGLNKLGQFDIVESALAGLGEHEFSVLLEDAGKKRVQFKVRDPKLGMGYLLILESQRLGEDTGRDILMHGADEIRKVHRMAAYVVKPPSNAELLRLRGVFQQKKTRKARAKKK